MFVFLGPRYSKGIALCHINRYFLDWCGRAPCKLLNINIFFCVGRSNVRDCWSLQFAFCNLPRSTLAIITHTFRVLCKCVLESLTVHFISQAFKEVLKLFVVFCFLKPQVAPLQPSFDIISSTFGLLVHCNLLFATASSILAITTFTFCFLRCLCFWVLNTQTVLLSAT